MNDMIITAIKSGQVSLPFPCLPSANN